MNRSKIITARTRVYCGAVLMGIFLLFFRLLLPLTAATAQGKAYLCGDSLMVGMAFELKSVLSDCVSLAKGGLSTYAFDKHPPLDLKYVEAGDLIIISLGTNDLFTEAYAERVESIAKRLKATKARVLWLLPPLMKRADLKRRLPRISAVLKEICERNGIETVDLGKAPSKAYEEHTKDGVHYSRKGYAVLAGYVLLNM